MTDNQQPPAPPERIWIQMKGYNRQYKQGAYSAERLEDADTEYARVHLVDEGQVGESRQLIQDMASFPFDLLMDENAPRLAIMGSVSTLRHMQARAREIVAAAVSGSEPLDQSIWHKPDEEMPCGKEIIAIHDGWRVFSVGSKHEVRHLLGRLEAWTTRNELLRDARKQMVSSSERRCRECGHNNVNRNNGLCVEWVDRKQRRCGHKCVVPATGATRSVVSMEAWTNIDEWLREHPEATAAECLSELVKRMQIEVAATGAGEGEPRGVPIISKHFDSGEVERRVRSTDRNEQSTTFEDNLRWLDEQVAAGWPTEEEAEAILREHGASGKDVANAFIDRLLCERQQFKGEADKLRTELSTARANTIKEAVEAVKRVPVLNHAGGSILRDKALAALQSLAEQKGGEDDQRNPTS